MQNVAFKQLEHAVILAEQLKHFFYYPSMPSNSPYIMFNINLLK